MNTTQHSERLPTPGTTASTTTIEIEDVNAYARLCLRVHLSRRAPAPGMARPLFVMVHGIGMSHRYFDTLQAVLIEHGDTLILDLPGFGGTARPEQHMSVQRYADVIAGVLDGHQVSGAVVIGHSMGAQFVTELAVSRPDLVSHLTLIGPVTDVVHRSAAKHTLMLAADSLIEQPLTNAMVGIGYIQCGIRWYLQELPVMLSYRLDERLPLVSCPVLVLRGSRDIISGHGWCEKLSCNAHEGQLVEIPGQPHAAHRGGAALVGAAILSGSFQHSAEQADARTEYEARPTEPRTGSVTHVAARPKALEMRSITVGDRQCRSHIMPFTPDPDRPAGSTDHATRAARVKVDGRTATVYPDGEGTVPVFVLIHGIGMSHRYFRRLGSVLAAYGDVHMIDLPGYGWTRRPHHASTNEATAALIGKILDDVRASSCVVIGHSMGVQSATELAIGRPDLVSHLVLIGAAVDVDHRTVRQQALRLAFNSIFEKPLLSMVQFLDVLRCGPRWYAAQLKLALSYPLEERLPEATQPVLVLRGSRDVVAGAAWSDTLARTAQHAQRGTIEGAPHAAHHSAASAVASAVTSFLDRR